MNYRLVLLELKFNVYWPTHLTLKSWLFLNWNVPYFGNKHWCCFHQEVKQGRPSSWFFLNGQHMTQSKVDSGRLRLLLCLLVLLLICDVQYWVLCWTCFSSLCVTTWREGGPRAMPFKTAGVDCKMAESYRKLSKNDTNFKIKWVSPWAFKFNSESIKW